MATIKKIKNYKRISDEEMTISILKAIRYDYPKPKPFQAARNRVPKTARNSVCRTARNSVCRTARDKKK